MNTELEQIAAEVDTLSRKLQALKEEIGKVIIGQEQTVSQLLITFLAGGHALLEGVPGLAKTLMIRTLAEAEDLLVDTHGADVVSGVWDLLDRAFDHFGVFPVLLERDFNIPPLATLLHEVDEIVKRQRRLQGVSGADVA